MFELTAESHESEEQAGLSPEERRVLRWRFRELRKLGLSHVEARLLAESGADLNLVRRLVATGCPPSLALKIAL